MTTQETHTTRALRELVSDQPAVHPDIDDDQFTRPYVDVEEWREEPVRHRYVHGGFTGTRTRFSLYLPRAERYQGRFFQHITPVPDSEHLALRETGAASKIAMALASGAYFLETNGGGAVHTHGSDVDPTIGAYRANAACAQQSRAIAARVYGEHRPFGYAFGGSGGGFRTIGAAENTTGVWDGVVPFVIGSPMAIPNCFTVRLHALRVLRGAFDGIVDALEPGGSGDPYAHLSAPQREALSEVTAMGFPVQSWYAHDAMDLHGFAALFAGLALMDPGYFEDFWTVPGYLGADAPETLAGDRVQLDTTVLQVLTAADVAAGAHVAAGAAVAAHAGHGSGGVDDAWLGSTHEHEVPVAVRLSHPVDQAVLGAELVVTSGAAAGARFVVASVEGDTATFSPWNPDTMADLRAGDAVQLDNSRFLAAQTYHRHQVPGPDLASQYPVWDQFRRPDGEPRYPQRPFLVGPHFTAGASGTVPTGRFGGKMIVLGSLWDREAFPWQSGWYHARAAEHLGAELNERFRLWFTDHAVHADDEAQEHATHTVSYLGVLFQALRDLSAWVEDDVAPAPSTSYRVSGGQVLVPATAEERGGIQPVVDLSVGGSSRVEVPVGEGAVVRLNAEVPAGAGVVAAVEWDIDGDGTFPEVEGETGGKALSPGSRVQLERTVAYDRPGTHFVTARVTSQRDGDAANVHTRVQNLARVRVVVG